ncbi:hypothetical protein FGO68_gene8070 [Halteria grandinella]|uniref:Uncharacterized protein n=1 Tax=Halteria grandinella TaxID=5974 RepID=A0A8J8NGD3_HALGN|nr:hypothetical protein FGO68_gene8070 [Halteria grandinella]
MPSLNNNLINKPIEDSCILWQLKATSSTTLKVVTFNALYTVNHRAQGVAEAPYSYLRGQASAKWACLRRLRSLAMISHPCKVSKDKSYHPRLFSSSRTSRIWPLEANHQMGSTLERQVRKFPIWVTT